MRDCFGHFVFFFGGYVAIVKNDETFFLEADHNLAIVDIFDSWFSLVEVSVGVA